MALMPPCAVDICPSLLLAFDRVCIIADAFLTGPYRCTVFRRGTVGAMILLFSK